MLPTAKQSAVVRLAFSGKGGMMGWYIIIYIVYNGKHHLERDVACPTRLVALLRRGDETCRM